MINVAIGAGCCCDDGGGGYPILPEVCHFNCGRDGPDVLVCRPACAYAITFSCIGCDGANTDIRVVSEGSCGRWISCSDDVATSCSYFCDPVTPSLPFFASMAVYCDGFQFECFTGTGFTAPLVGDYMAVIISGDDFFPWCAIYLCPIADFHCGGTSTFTLFYNYGPVTAGPSVTVHPTNMCTCFGYCLP